MNVTVFGGAQPQPGQPAYQEAYNLGHLLAENGHTVLTGGYIGVMEAVSRGAAEAGGHVIGVTCDDIEAWRGIKANAWVREERHYTGLRERLFALIDGCDAAMALSGGVGTLAEITLMWNQMLIDAIPPRPLIAVGPAWRNVFSIFFDQMGVYIDDKHRIWLRYADDVEQAVRQLTGPPVQHS
jgi:uncharacterized protein (TIGR00725 family)